MLSVQIQATSDSGAPSWGPHIKAVNDVLLLSSFIKRSKSKNALPKSSSEYRPVPSTGSEKTKTRQKADCGPLPSFA